MQLMARRTDEKNNAYSVGTKDFGIGMLLRCVCNTTEFAIYSLRYKNKDNTFLYIMKDKYRSAFNVDKEEN